MSEIKLVICDDQEEILDYLYNLIGTQTDLKVVATAKSGEEAVATVEKTHPHVVLMDIQMETETAGINAIERITNDFPDVKSIVITVHESDELIIDAYLAGAVDYVIKTADVDTICERIRKAYNDESYIGALIVQKMRFELKNMRDKKKSFLFVINEISKLTPKEVEILRLLYLGNKQTEVAKMKCLEVSTIKFHVNNILRKLQFNSIKELNATLKEFGIFENDEFTFFGEIED